MSSQLPLHAVDRLLRLGGTTEPAAPDGGAFDLALDLGRYRPLRELGRGGMGRVYEAEDTLLRRRVALKIMPETAGLSEVLRRRFAREAQAAARLSHPNIAAVYDATPDYIAMQLIEGRVVLEVPRDDPRLVVRLLRDAALAVQYAHDQGIFHRDLKPTNLMVEGSADEARVFVLDFGLAKEAAAESSLSASGGILGTPAYMPPEQAEGRARVVDARSDVYGLGATMYACLTGKPPFEDAEVLGLLRRVVEEDAKPTRIDPDLDAIVLRCLAKEPQRRYQTARALADDLGRWLAGEAVQARPPSLGYRLRKFVRRRKAVVGVTAAAALLSLALALLALRQAAGRGGAMRAVKLADESAATLTNAQVDMREERMEDFKGRLDECIAKWRAFLADYEIADGHYFLGRLLRVRGHRDEARAALDRALALEPGHAAAHFERALLVLADLGRARARQRLGPTGNVDADRLAADERLVKADLQDALRDETRLRSVDVRFANAELERLGGDIAAAERELQAILEVDQYHGEARFALRRLYVGAGRITEAARWSGGMTADLLNGFAPVFLSRGDVAPVERRVDPPDPAWLVVDPLHLAALEVPLVDADAQLARQPGPGTEAAARGLARLREALAAGSAEALAAWDRAVLAHDEAIAAVPNLAGAYHNRGVCHHQRSRVLLRQGSTAEAVAAEELAIADFGKAANRLSAFAGALLGRAAVHMNQAERLAAFGRLPQAVVACEQAVADGDAAVELSAQDPWARRSRGHAKAKLAEWLAALGDGQRARGVRDEARTDLDLALRQAAADWPWRSACERERAALQQEGG